jgi:hypothetical protein
VGAYDLLGNLTGAEGVGGYYHNDGIRLRYRFAGTHNIRGAGDGIDLITPGAVTRLLESQGYAQGDISIFLDMGDEDMTHLSTPFK